MDFIELAIIVMLCVLSFLLGQKLIIKNNLPAKNDKYKSLPDTYEEDEEVFCFIYFYF